MSPGTFFTHFISKAISQCHIFPSTKIEERVCVCDQTKLICKKNYLSHVYQVTNTSLRLPRLLCETTWVPTAGMKLVGGL